MQWQPPTPPVTIQTYWQNLHQLVEQSLRRPHQGLPPVSVRSADPKLQQQAGAQAR